MQPFVKVIKAEDPCTSAYEAMSSVLNHDVKGKRVLLKPNTGFKGPAKTGLCTHPEVIRGLIRFFKSQGAAEVITGDSSVIGINSWEALKSAGIYEVCEQEGAICMDLNDSSPVEMKIINGYVVDSILLSSIIYDVDLVVSVPVMKTHMYTGASLGIKNMKGAMYKREKNKLHRLKKSPPPGAKERSLDFGILDLTTVCYPDYIVTDGIIGMEGFGPSGGTPRAYDMIVASATPIACDMISLQLMGMSLSDAGHIKLIAQREGLTYDRIRVEPADYKQYCTRFLTPSEAKLEVKCDNLEYIDESACSGCHTALLQFMRYHADKFQDGGRVTIFAGKDIDEKEIISRGNRAFLVGNCTAKYSNLAPFCKGCPPVDSEILKMVKGLGGVTVKYLGHSAFCLQTKDYNILIDPYLSDNPLASDDWENIKVTHICVTHGHYDHVGDTVQIAQKNGAEVYSTCEVAKEILKGIDVIAGDIGGVIKTEFGSVKLVRAIHSSGVCGGNACGFVLDVEGIKIYHAGDTALTTDMQLLAREKIDVALLPIGGRYTMGPSDAVEAVKLIEPKIVVPMHYNTNITIAQEPYSFQKAVEIETESKVKVLSSGESFSI